METILFGGKLFGLILAAILAPLGVVYEYRNRQTNKLTPVGKWALFLIVIGSLIAVFSHFFEERVKDKAAREAVDQAAASSKRSEIIETDIARSLQPLDVRYIYVFDLEVPMIDKRFSNLRSSIDATIKNYFRDYGEKSPPVMLKDIEPGNVSCPDLALCRAVSANILPTNSSFPKIGLEGAIFKISHLDLSIYRKPIPVTDFNLPGSKSPDLLLHFSTEPGRKALSIQHELSTPKYALNGGLGLMKKSIGNGKIVSTLDLSGAHIFLTIRRHGTYFESTPQGLKLNIAKAIREADKVISYERKFELGALGIFVGDRVVQIQKNAWSKHVTPTAVFWETTLPADPFKASERFRP